MPVVDVRSFCSYFYRALSGITFSFSNIYETQFLMLTQLSRNVIPAEAKAIDSSSVCAPLYYIGIRDACSSTVNVL